MASRAGRSAQLEQYARAPTRDELAVRVMTALDRRVLAPRAQKLELRAYFEMVVDQIASAFGAGDDAISAAAPDDLEQSALLLCQYDADGDGRLSPSEFSALIQLVSSQTGEPYQDERVEQACVYLLRLSSTRYY